MQQESLMKEQVVRIERIHQEFFLWQQLGGNCGSREGAIESIPGNGRIAQAWVNVRGRLRIFSFFFWQSEGWSSRNEAPLEAVLKRTRTSKHPWLIACDANMDPEDFEKGLWFRKDQMYVMAPEGVSTCRSRSVKGERVEKVYDYVRACSCLNGRISDIQVVEDFGSRPHKAVTFVVQRGKERPWIQRRKTTRKKHGREREGRRRRKRTKAAGNEKIEEGIRCSQGMNKRTSQSERVKDTKEKKTVPGWSKPE